MSTQASIVKHLVKFWFVDRDDSVVYEIDELSAGEMKDALNEVEGKTWPFHWFQTVHGFDVAVSQDGIEMVNLLFEIGERDVRKRNEDNDFDLLIYFKGRPGVPYECDAACPKEVTRLFLALSKGFDEDGPFVSFEDINGEPVLLDARKVLYVESPTDVVQEGWTEVIQEDLEADQTPKKGRNISLVPPRGKKTTRTRRTKKPAKP